MPWIALKNVFGLRSIESSNPAYTITAIAEYAMDQIPEKPGNKTVSVLEQMKMK